MKKQQFIDFLNSCTTTEKAEYLTSLGIAATTDESLAGEVIKTGLMAKAMAGDMVFVCDPATVDTKVSNLGTRTVSIQLQTADGDLHTWFTKTISNGLTLAESTNGNGTTSFASGSAVTAADAVFTNGRCSATVYDIGTWAEDDTGTLIMAETIILGYTIAAATSIETIIADSK